MRKVIEFNEEWKFTKEGKSETVNIPHCWNAVDGQEGADYYRGECVYEKTLSGVSGKTYIEVGAANSVSAVYVNGEGVGTHRGGYSLFRYDITKYLTGNDDKIKITVDNSDFDDVYPSTADFTFYGGIYRSVKIITDLADCHFSLTDGLCGIYADPVKTDSGWKVNVTGFMQGNKAGKTVQYALYSKDGDVVAKAETSAENPNAVLEVENPVLWNGMENPYLYTLKGVVLSGEEEIDCAETRIGFRTVEFDSEKGCILNGKHIKLKGVSRHQDRYHMGNALTAKEHVEDLEIIKDIGANSIRLAHYQHDQIFYDTCDEMGFLVWAEVPVISRFSDKKIENSKSQLRELISQNRNHPCIFCWGIQNEISMGGQSKSLVKFLNQMNDLAHSLDPHRPTTSAQVMMCDPNSDLNKITDIQGYNIYFGWYLQTFNAIDKWFDKFHQDNPNVKLCLSEYGAEGIVKYQSPDGGVQGDYSETYQARLHEHYARAIEERQWLWGSYVWNMFDFGAANRNEGGVKGRNNKGLVTFDRKIKKDSFYVYKAFWSDVPFVHIGGERYVQRKCGETIIPVYSNLPEVTLTVNGEEFTFPCDRVAYFDKAVIKSGENIVTAKAGDCTHSITIMGAEEDDPEYRLPGDAHSMVKNWFGSDSGEIRPDYFSINDKVGDLLKSPDVLSLLGTVDIMKKVPPFALALIKPFKVKTLLKLAPIDDGIKEIANQYLQTIKK